MQWSFQCFEDHGCTGLLISFQSIYQFCNFLGCMDVCRSASCYNAFFYGCSCCIQSIFHTQFCFFHLCFGSCTDTDHCYAACQFRKSLLQFFFIKFRSCNFDRSFDLCDSVFDFFLIAHSVNDNGILFFHFDRFCTSKLADLCIFQFQSQFFGNDFTAGQDCDIFEHFFSSVTITWSFYTDYLESTTQFVQNQSRQSFSFDILCDDQQFLTGLYNLLQQRQNLLDIGNLFVCDQDVRIIQDSFHFFHIGCHVCGNIAAVKLHTFYQIQFCFHGLGLFNRDNTIIRNFFHGICYHISDFIITCGNSCYSCHLMFAVYFAAHSCDSIHSCLCCFFHTFTQDDRVCTCCQIFHTCLDHCLSQNGSSCGTITCYIIGLGSNFFYQLCTHVLECIFQLDLLCNGNTVVCNERSTILFIQNNVSSFRSKCYFYCICQFINTCCQCCSCF